MTHLLVMKKITILFLVSCLLFNVDAQNFDHLMTRKPLECRDVSYNCASYFVEYYQEGKIDSASQMVDYWQDKCDYRDPVIRAKMLLDLKTGHFSEWFVDDNIFDFISICIYRYNSLSLSAANSYDNNQAEFAYIEPLGEFDKAIAKLAAELQSFYPVDSYERLWVNFLAHPSTDIFLAIQNGQFADTQFAKLYQQRLQQLLKIRELNIALMGGIWIPTGQLTTLGCHPGLGFQFGSHSQKSFWDLTMIFRFGDTSHTYYAYPYTYSKEKVPTNYYFGGYIGLDWAKPIVHRPEFDYLVLLGFGYDGFDVNDLNYYDPDASSVNSYNFNVGLGYNFYYSTGAYLGIQAKYNIIDYTLNDVIDLRGNALTINILWGVSFDANKYRQLQQLGYLKR